MAAQRLPLGHKGRGEAAAAGMGPSFRAIRGRYARGMRNEAAQKYQTSQFSAYRPQSAYGRTPPNFESGRRPFGRFAN